MSAPEKDYEDKVGSNGIQASSGPAYGPDAVGRGSDEEKASGGPDGTWGHINGGSFVSRQVVCSPHTEGSPDGNVKRTLKERHLSMIALGGAIGTGK